MSIKSEIVKLLDEHKYVSFAQMSQVAGFSGDLSLVCPGYQNLILWHSISKEGISAIEHILSENIASLESCELLVYICDGVVPNMKIAKSLRNYKDPRFLPCVLALN